MVGTSVALCSFPVGQRTQLLNLSVNFFLHGAIIRSIKCSQPVRAAVVRALCDLGLALPFGLFAFPDVLSSRAERAALF